MDKRAIVSLSPILFWGGAVFLNRFIMPASNWEDIKLVLLLLLPSLVILINSLLYKTRKHFVRRSVLFLILQVVSAGAAECMHRGFSLSKQTILGLLASVLFTAAYTAVLTGIYWLLKRYKRNVSP